MIFKVILIASMLLLLLVTIKMIRTCKIPSLLSVQSLLVALVLDVPACFLQSLVGNVQEINLTFDPVIERRILVCLTLANLIAIVGTFILIAYQGRRTRTFQRYWKSPVVFHVETPMFIAFCGVVLVGFLVFLRSSMASSAFTNAAQVMGDYQSYYMLRYEMSQAELSNVTRYSVILFMYIGMPLINLISLQNALSSKNKLWYVAWATSFALLVFGSLALLQKAPIVIAFLTNIVGVLFSLVVKGVKVWKFAVPAIAAGAVVILFVNLMLKTLGASTDLETSLMLIYQRIFEVPLVTAYAHFQVFPDMHPYTHFSSSHTLNLFLGFGDYVDTGGLSSWEIAAYYSTGLVFNMNTGFLGASWAEMGYIGVIEGAVIIYGLCFLWDILLIKFKMRAAHVLLAAYFLGRFMNIHNNELMYMLLAGGLVLAPLMLLVLRVKVRNFAPFGKLTGDEIPVSSSI